MHWGAMNGKLKDMVSLLESHSHHYNNKARHSMVPLVIVEARNLFILAHFRTNRRISDACVLYEIMILTFRSSII